MDRQLHALSMSVFWGKTITFNKQVIKLIHYFTQFYYLHDYTYCSICRVVTGTGHLIARDVTTQEYARGGFYCLHPAREDA